MLNARLAGAGRETRAYLVGGGSVKWITVALLVIIGLVLTLAPVVYVWLERAEMVKVAAVLVLLAVGAAVAITADAWADKGFGMGRYVPRITSVTGKPEAAPSTGFIFEPTDEHLTRWRGWWRFANRVQLYTFVLITIVTILFTSLLAYSTVYGKTGLENNIGFLQTEGEQLKSNVGTWFGVLFGVLSVLTIIEQVRKLFAD